MMFLIALLIGCAASRKEAYPPQEYPAGDVSRGNTGDSSASKSSSAGLSGKKLQEQTKRILSYEGYIHLLVPNKNKEEIIENIAEYVRNQKGFIFSQNKTSLTFKIPSKYFRKTFSYIKTKGEVDEENIRIIDITDSYYDTKIRLENSENLQKRLIELLKKAQNVSETVEVEKELSRVTQDIETLKAAMRRYQSQIDYSSISVYFRDSSTPGPLGWFFYGVYIGVKWLFIWE